MILNNNISVSFMEHITSEDIWLIILGIGVLLTMSPGTLILSSIYFSKSEDTQSPFRKYFLSFLLLFLAFSFGLSGVYMVLAEASNPIRGLPITTFLGFAISFILTFSMISVRQFTSWLKDQVKDR